MREVFWSSSYIRNVESTSLTILNKEYWKAKICRNDVMEQSEIEPLKTIFETLSDS